MAISWIPTVDLSLFISEDHEEDTERARKIISGACSDYGMFEIVNHCVPLALMSTSLELSKSFFKLPIEEKLKWSHREGAPLPDGYIVSANTSNEKFENLNLVPPQQASMKEIEELFLGLTKTASLVESILNDCLGLPPKFLQEYNTDRSCDLLRNWKYSPATETRKKGLNEHQDAKYFTIVFADEQGLEVLTDGAWIPVVPTEGSLVVMVADLLQVISNNTFKSSIHRVLRPKGKSRHSYVFFYNIDGNKWIEPVPELTTHIGQPAKYRGFLHKDYQQVRIKEKIHPPSRPEDYIKITHFAITE